MQLSPHVFYANLPSTYDSFETTIGKVDQTWSYD